MLSLTSPRHISTLPTREIASNVADAQKGSFSGAGLGVNSTRSGWSLSAASEREKGVSGKHFSRVPLRAEIVQSKKEDDQTFTTIKFVFPRGDATSLLFGFDAAGKISDVALGGLAGD